MTEYSTAGARSGSELVVVLFGWSSPEARAGQR